jgi:hypothetical protein
LHLISEFRAKALLGRDTIGELTDPSSDAALRELLAKIAINADDLLD